MHFSCGQSKQAVSMYIILILIQNRMDKTSSILLNCGQISPREEVDTSHLYK